MRLTIIKSDNLVSVDGKALSGLDLTAVNMPNNLHAFQWYGDNGEIEFVENPDRSKPLNEITESLPVWADKAYSIWQKVNQEIIDEQLRLQAEIEAKQLKSTVIS